MSKNDQAQFIQELIEDREKFDVYVYTDWRTAVAELADRQADRVLEAYTDQIEVKNIPGMRKDMRNAVLFRQLATPNYEAHRFMMCVDVLQDFNPVIFEYQDDLFTDINVLKRALGKMPFHKRLNKHREPIIEYRSVIDMSKWNGKPLSSIRMIDGSSFADFHRNFFVAQFPTMKDHIFDLSSWIESVANTELHWYKDFLTLFLRDGILFDNFLTTSEDLHHTRDVFLPAFIQIVEETGSKPLIVALEPTDIEGDAFWHSYPYRYIGSLPS